MEKQLNPKILQGVRILVRIAIRDLENQRKIAEESTLKLAKAK